MLFVTTTTDMTTIEAITKALSVIESVQVLEGTSTTASNTCCGYRSNNSLPTHRTLRYASSVADARR
jgi:hypothetical protein